jgi:ribosomal protein S17E
MGRIKSSGIKKAARTLAGDNEDFTKDFEENKKLLAVYDLPDKGTRNKIAGYITRLKRAEKKQVIAA